MGAARVVLVGYDMRVVDGREHHHAEYSGPRDLDQYAREFVPAFNGWRAAAEAVGAEIVNATPGRRCRNFRFVDSRTCSSEIPRHRHRGEFATRC
jgi:hypothetical protein